MITVFILTVQVVLSLIAIALLCGLAYLVLMMIGICITETCNWLTQKWNWLGRNIPYLLGRMCRACGLGKATKGTNTYE